METYSEKFAKVNKILERAPKFDKNARISTEEFKKRASDLYKEMQKAGIECALVYSDEHYHGDVPYLGGNINFCIEPCAGLLGVNGFHLLAGLEGGYASEQMGKRSGCTIHKAEFLKLADEEYPVDAEDINDILMACCGKIPKNIGIFTPRAVLPVGVYEFFADIVGVENMIDAQDIYLKYKYIKSDQEMKLTKQAARIADISMECMLAVLEPGMLETEVAAWGYFAARSLGCENMGFDVMVTSGEANRTLIGKAMNFPIKEGDYVHLGIGPTVDGLTACERCTVIATLDPSTITEEQHYWINFVEGAYKTGLENYIKVAENNLPAKLQEQALVDYFNAHADEVAKRIGHPINMEKQKPYTGTHNGGYTECQEFYGAITLNSDEPLGEQIVTMLDVAARGIGSKWDDVVIPGFDFALVEKTLGKWGKHVEVLNELPINVQKYVGRVVE